MQVPTPAGLAEWREAAASAADAVVTRHVDGDHVLVLRRWPRAGAPIVVLVHGVGMGQQYFSLLRHALSAELDVIAVDLPGFGDSPRPESGRPLPELADLLADGLRSLVDEPVVALGHSMGAQIVAELAARHPELVTRVVLLAPTVNPEERSGWMQPWRLLQDVSNDSPVVSMVGLRLYAQAGVRWYLRELRSMLDHDLREVLPRVQQPTLVIRGEEDRVVPAAWASEVRDLLPHGELRIARGKGHEAMLTGADPLATIVMEFAA